MDYEFSTADYLRLLKRRWPIFAVSFALVLALGSGVIFATKSFYMSYGTILVESQQIPEALIQSTITSQAQERIRVIEQRVITRANLIRLIEKYKLFDDRAGAMSTTEMIDLVRGRLLVEIDTIASENRRARGERAVVFTVSYEDPNPRKALRMTNEIVTLFLEENVRTRTARASETTQFLEKEANRLESELTQLEGDIAIFKSENSNTLPENLELHFSQLERARTDHAQNKEAILRARDELRLYDLEIAALETGQSTSTNGKVSPHFTPKRELLDLQSQLAERRLQYLDSHPEIQTLLDRIAAVKEQLTADENREALAKQIAELESERIRLVADHGLLSTEVQSLDSRIAFLRSEITELGGEDPLADARTNFHLQEARLAYRRDAIAQRLHRLESENEKLAANIQDLEARILATPEVERELASRERAYETVLEQFNAITAKQKDAELAQNLEQDQKAERFVLLEPPVLADEPTSPNRPKLFAVALLFSGGVAAATAFLRDLFLGTIHSASQLAHALAPTAGAAVRVISVPRLFSSVELRSRRHRLRLIMAGLALAFLLLLLAIHLFYSPLDILFYKTLARLS